MENALFLAKKILGGLLMPLPLTFLLLFWAILLLFRKKTRWCGFLFLFAATGLLFVASYAPFSSQVTAPLEQEFAAYQPGGDPAEYIAVLGSGHVSADDQPVTSELGTAAVVRIVEGIRICRLNPGSKLIFTGFKGLPHDPIPYPDKAKELALALGVAEEDVLTFPGPKDTTEEARLIAEKFADAHLILVTSASHMPRAMGLFRTAGLDPIPAPTNHLSRPASGKWTYPDAHVLANTQSWAHEQLGLLWSQMTGQIKREKSAEE